MARKIEVELVGDSRSLERAFGRAQGSGSKLGRALGVGLKGAAIAGGAALAGLGVAAKIGFDEFNQGQKVAAQTRAVIKSTGQAANVTAEHVSDLAEALMKKTGVDDEAIASGQNMLLTFKQIRNEAGKGNDIFDQATKATLDLSVAMGKDMSDSAIMVGKALNDPIRGLTAMRRVGIQFTAAQEKQIKKMVEAGDVMGAQKKILKELESQFGGSAKAAGKTFAGQINILRESFNNWAGDMVGRVMPALQGFVRRIARADGFRAKLKVVWTGVKEAGRDLVNLLKDSVFGSVTRTPLRLDSGKIIEWKTSEQKGLVQSIQDGLRTVDWSEVGARIGEGISKRVRITADFISTALTAMNQFIDSNIDKFAEVGAKLMLAVIGKLLDPAFWIRNWQLVLGVAVAVFPIGRVAKLGVTIARGILSPIGKLLPDGFRNIGFRAVQAILGQLGRLPGSVQKIIVAVVSGAINVLGRLVGFLRGQVAGVLSRVPGWLKAAFRLSFFMAFVSGIQAGWARVRQATAAAVDFLRGQWAKISGPISTAVGWLRTLYDWLVKITSRPWTIDIDIPTPSVPSWLDPRNIGRAAGGPVAAGMPYIVGERGPELFMPRASGTIIPNHRLRSGGGGAPVVDAHVTFQIGEDVLLRAVRRAERTHLRRNGG